MDPRQKRGYDYEKNRLIIFIALLSTISISVLNTVYADIINEPQIDSNNILTISGETENGFTPITLKIYEAGKDITNDDLNNLSDMYYHIREIVSNLDGSYKFQIPLKGEEKQFNIRIKEGKSDVIEKNIIFTNSSANEALQALKRSNNIQDVKSAVNSFLLAVDFGFELYEENKSDIEKSDLLYEIINSVKDTEVNSQSDLKNLSEYATVLYALSNADNVESFTSIFNNYNKQIFAYDSDIGALYNNQCTSESVKADIIRRLYDKHNDESVYSNKNRFRNLVQESVILSCCEKNLGCNAFDSVIDVLAKIYNNDAVFISSYNKYNSMAQAKKNDTALEIIGHSFSNTGEIIKKINDVVDKAETVLKPSGGGSSSGSGGGGGGFIPSTGKTDSAYGFNSETNTDNVNNTISVNIPQKTNTAMEFNDLENVMWAVDSILDLASRGIVEGKQENTFAPLDSITREEFIKMLVSAIGIPVDNNKCNFNDVDENAWYYKYVAAGYVNGIINGIDDMNFGRGSLISRQDVATMVGRIMKKMGIDMDSQNQAAFADDNKISDYANESVYGLKALGIINGKENNVFAPRDSTNRAEAAMVISSMIGYIENFSQTK